MSWTTGFRPYLALTLFCLILFLPGLASVPPLDRDESRFAQATAQMLESGNFVDIRFQDTPRHKKPAGVYWLQAAAVTALSSPEAREIWAYRVPSALAALAAALMTFAFGAPLFGRRTALLGASLLAGSLLVVLEAHQAKTDAVLLACAVAAQGALARLYLAGRSGERAGIAMAMLFWFAQGLAMLIKGPIVPMVSALTVLALLIADRRAAWLRALHPLFGVPLMVLVAAPWFLAIQKATGGAFVDNAVGGDLLPKLMGSQESHGAPPGYYTILMLAFFWPGSLFAWPALVRAWKERKDAALRFCLAWLVPSWLVFEAVPTKLPHYVLPLYPALALITAALILAATDAFAKRWVRGVSLIWALLGIGLAGAAVALPFVYGHGFTLWSLPVAAGALAAALWPLMRAWNGRMVAAAAAALTAATITFAATFQFLMPGLDALWLSRSVAEAVERIDPERTRPVASVGFHEPSLVFLLGTGTELVNPPRGAALLAKGDALVAVSSRESEAFANVLKTSGIAAHEEARVSGFNYSRGRPLTIVIYGPAAK